MKPQDIVFFLVFVGLLIRQNPKISAAAGMVCLLLAIPLFAFWKFFTAEHLTWYGAAFFLLAIILMLRKSKTS